MGKVVSSLLGGGSPKVSAAPVAETEEKKRTAQGSRSALYETEGGAMGAELSPDDVGRRKTLLGN